MNAADDKQAAREGAVVQPGHFAVGRHAERAGLLDEARSAYEAAVAREPDSAECHYRLGCVCLKQDDAPAAETSFHAAARFAAEPTKALTNLGVSLDRQGRREDAVRAYRRAIRHGGTAVAHHNLGAIYAETGRIGEAVASFEAAIALEPDAEGFLNLGLVHYANEDFVRAREYFDKAVASDPDFALGHYHAGLCLLRTGMYETGRERFEQAWRLDPRLARSPYHLGVCLHKLERYEDARSRLEEALEGFPEDGRIHYQLALTCDALGLHQEARLHYGRARALEPRGR